MWLHYLKMAFRAMARQRFLSAINLLGKVLGARSRDIFRLLLWLFLKPVAVANLIAWPAAYLIARTWLAQFAYRIEMPVSAFLMASLAASSIAAVAIALHTLEVARANPAGALKSE